MMAYFSRKEALDYAMVYCDKIAEAKFQTPTDFVAVAEIIYEFLNKDGDKNVTFTVRT